MARLKIDRQTLAKFLPNQEAIVAFEKMFSDVGETIPGDVASAAALASAASALANLALELIAENTSALEQLSMVPSIEQPPQDDPYIPAVHIGALASQDPSAVDITGGSINGTTIGDTDPSTGAFTTLTASSTVTLSPANAAVTLSPTGTGVVTINPASTGALDNVTIGATTAKTVRGTTLESTVATGTAPLIVASTTVVPNLNVSQLLGKTWAIPDPIGATTPSSGAFTTVSATGQITSTLATGTAPLVVASTTKVANLNSDLLDGTDWNAPGAIGGVTPGSAAFTTVSASGQITSTVATGTPPFVVASFTNVPALNCSLLLGFNWVTPGTIGSTTANTGRFTTVTATGAFGCNTKAAQTSFASGGALAAYSAGANGLDTGANMSALHALVVSIRAALVANGIMS